MIVLIGLHNSVQLVLQYPHGNSGAVDTPKQHPIFTAPPRHERLGARSSGGDRAEHGLQYRGWRQLDGGGPGADSDGAGVRLRRSVREPEGGGGIIATAITTKAPGGGTGQSDTGDFGSRHSACAEWRQQHPLDNSTPAIAQAIPFTGRDIDAIEQADGILAALRGFLLPLAFAVAAYCVVQWSRQ